MKKTFAALLTLLLSITMVSYAAPEVMVEYAQQPEVRLCAFEDIGKFDPFEVSTDLQYEAVRYVYDTLYYINEDEKAQPMVGDKLLINEASTEYRVELKSGLKWHDGSYITPEEVAASFERAKSSTWYGKHLRAMGNVAVEGKEIIFSLQYPDPVFMEEAIAYVPISKAVDGKDVGSGMYQLQSINDGNAELVSTDYHLGLPIVQKIFIDRLASSTDCAQGVVDGKYMTVFGNVDVDAFGTFNQLAKEAVNIYGLKSKVMVMNNQSYPMDNVNLRKAFASAIDFDRIVNDVYKGEADRGKPGFFSPRTDFNLKENNYVMDVNNAISMLTNVGYQNANGKLVDPVGRQVTVALQVEGGIDEQIGQIIKENLSAMGVMVELSVVSAENLNTAVKDDNFQMAIINLGNFYQSTEASLLTLLNEENYSNYYSDSMGQAVDKYLNSVTKADQRYLSLMGIQELIAADAPFITLCYPRTLGGYIEGRFEVYAYKKGVGIYSHLSFMPNNKKFLAKIGNPAANTQVGGGKLTMYSIMFVIGIIAISFGVLVLKGKIKKK